MTDLTGKGKKTVQYKGILTQAKLQKIVQTHVVEAILVSNGKGEELPIPEKIRTTTVIDYNDTTGLLETIDAWYTVKGALRKSK